MTPEPVCCIPSSATSVVKPTQPITPTIKAPRIATLVLLLLLSALLPAAPGELIVKDGDTLAFLGDSITTAGEHYDGYGRMVVHGLKVHGVSVKPVFAGVPGNTSAMMLERLERDVLSHKPDWVFLATGVNDIWHGDPTVKIGVFQPKPGMGVGLEDYRRKVREIVDRCQAAGARVILSTITPIREEADFKLNRTARDYNSFLRDLAREHELPIALLHEAMFAEIAKGRRLTSDGVHPLEAGHAVMAMGILEAMGLDREETQALGERWASSPRLMILGDRQTTSGTRPGGWCHRLLDGMNTGDDLWSLQIVAHHLKAITVADLSKSMGKQLNERTKVVLLQAPHGDAKQGTPPEAYRTQLMALVEAIRKAGRQPLLSTLALRGEDPASEANQRLEPYNRVLREVAAATATPLADLDNAMREHFRQHPDQPLTYDGERFNAEGSRLLVEAVLRALGRGEAITPQLRQTWQQRRGYWEKYQK